MSPPQLSVVIPAFDEDTRLRRTLEKILAYLQGRGICHEIIVVDDGSTDQTFQVACQLAEEYPAVRVLKNETNRGKGYSVRRGMLEAQGTYALLTDADLSTPIEEVVALEEAVAQGDYAIAFGSRDLPGSRVEIHQSWFRETSGKIFNRMVRFLTGLPYRDTQCGFKLFSMERCRDIFKVQRVDSFGFDVEILYVARKWNLPVAEVPVVWRHSGGSKVRLLPDAFRMLFDLLAILYNERRGHYDRKEAP